MINLINKRIIKQQGRLITFKITDLKMKNRIWIYQLIIIGLFFLANNCEKDEDPSTITDADGNIYTSVTIGTQVWMKENLKTTKYSDGTIIPLVTEGAEWAGLSTPAYCWYSNDMNNKNVYGAL